MYIKENNKPDLKVCEMVCDKPLHKKLDDYELSHFFNNHSTNLFVGRPGSGKTSILYSLFESKKLLKKVYHNIYLFQPSSSRLSMKDKLFEKLPDENKFEELDLDSLSEVMERIKAEDSKFNNCIIFDDQSVALKNNDTLKLLKELIFNRRHIRTSVFFLTQTFFSVPKEIRRLFSNVFVFKVSRGELTTIFEELVEKRKDCMMEISKLVYDKPHNFLYINTETQRLFKGWDEIIIEDDECEGEETWSVVRQRKNKPV